MNPTCDYTLWAGWTVYSVLFEGTVEYASLDDRPNTLSKGILTANMEEQELSTFYNIPVLSYDLEAPPIEVSNGCADIVSY